MKAKNFGLYIKQLRLQRGLTIRQVELYSGVSNSYLSQLENGKRGIPSADIINKIASPLGVSPNKLMSKAGYIKEKPNCCTNDELDLAKRIDLLREELLYGKPLRFKGKPLSKETTRVLLKIINDVEHQMNQLNREYQTLSNR